MAEIENKFTLLESVFGYPSFRGQQAEVIDHLASGNSALVLMPTGAGKSLCYQIPALIRSGFALVVSPLIALMNDQVQALKQFGVRAESLHSQMEAQRISDTMRAMKQGKIDLVYVSPERLGVASFLDFLAGCEISLIAIDEAHCISQWGHDFRPDYIQLTQLIHHFPRVPRIALTATADELTREEIREKLGLGQDRVFVSGFDRPNIHYTLETQNLSDFKPRLLDFLGSRKESGIIYCPTRKRVDEIADWLQGKGFPALPYHAGLTAEEREQHQDTFIKGDYQIMVATIAFGMGIDKPDVRFVIHLGLPKSVEAYYQETGRAGRDGLPAQAWLVYGLRDIVTIRGFIESSQADKQQKQIERNKFDSLLALLDTSNCRRKVLLRYFGDHLEEDCGHCDNCDHPVEKFDASIPVLKALSCVYRTGEKFGVVHLIDVLQGNSTEKVIRFKHHLIKTFGVGKEISSSAWKYIFRQMVQSNLLFTTGERYGGLSLTEEGRDFLRKRPLLELKKIPETQTREKARSEQPTLLENQREQEVFQELKKKRRELAQALDLPPYIIFHDRTLLEMVRRHPRTLEELRQVSGVGDKKLESYGKDFLKVLLHPETGVG